MGTRSRFAAGLIPLLLSVPWGVLAAQHNTGRAHAPQHATAPSVTGDEALRRLVEGNKRFESGRLLQDHESAEWRAGLAAGQHPIAIVVSCSDSRVPPELVFDQGLGDVFVIRVAGHVVNSDAAASVEYAVLHLGSPLVVVLGHEKCGAVTSALASKQDRAHEPAAIQGLLEEMQPALTGLGTAGDAEARVHKGVEANVRYAIRQFQTTEEYKKILESSHVKVVGGVYDLATGHVRILE